jgi:predicted nucleic acid-binding Zn ribbon protein
MMDELQQERQRQRLEKLQQRTKEKRRNERVQRREAKREQREADNTLFMKSYQLSAQDKEEAPLYEVLATTFNLAAPSFAPLRSRLTIHLRSVIAKLEYDTSKRWNLENASELQQELDRAREILKILDPVPHCHCASCGKPFVPSRRDAVTCSPACRQREYRKRVTDKAAREAHP